MKQLWTKLGVQIILTFVAAFGWWGLFFPEFTLNQDTVVVCTESIRPEGASQDAQQSDLPPSGEDLLVLLLNAKPEDVAFRSKLLKVIKDFWEHFSWDKLTWN